MIEDQNFPIKEDDFIIINSNTSHTERSVGEIPLEYIILGVEGLNFSFGGEHEHLIFNCRRDHEEFAYFMDSLLEEMENKRPHYELVCQDLLNMLIVKLIRRTNFSFEFVPSVKSSRECIKLKQYMEANYNQNITLDTLAQVSHLNKYYMVHAFTPVSYTHLDVYKRQVQSAVGTTSPVVRSITSHQRLMSSLLLGVSISGYRPFISLILKASPAAV